MNENTEHNVVWGVEIGGSAVRMIRVTRTGSAYRADRFIEAPLDGRWNGSSGAAAALGRLGAQKVDEPVVVCLRDELILHRTIQLPAVDGDALAEMIAGQLEVLIPTQADQFVWGHHAYGADDGDDLRSVWVAAARSDAVSTIAEGCRRFGRRADRIVPSLAALVAIWAHGDDTDPVVLLDVAAGCTALAVVHRGGVRECGVVDEGVDRWIERIAERAEMSLPDAQALVETWLTTGEPVTGAAGEALTAAVNDWARHLREVCGHCLWELPVESRPGRAILFGRGGAGAPVADAVALALGIPAVAAEPPAWLHVPDDVPFDRAAPAIGAALCAMASEAPSIDLMTPEPDRPAGRKALRPWVVIVGWLLLATIGLYLQDRSKANHLEKAVADVAARTARQGGLTRQKAVGDYLESLGATPMDLLDRLSALLPAEALLTSFNHTRTRTADLVTLGGLVPDAKAMPKMLDDLRVLGDVTGEGRPDNKKFRFEVRIEIDRAVGRLARRDPPSSQTQPADEPVATTQSSTQPAGTADPSAVPATDPAEPPQPNGGDEPPGPRPQPPSEESEARARVEAAQAAAAQAQEVAIRRAEARAATTGTATTQAEGGGS